VDSRLSLASCLDKNAIFSYCCLIKLETQSSLSRTYVREIKNGEEPAGIPHKTKVAIALWRSQPQRTVGCTS